MSYKHDFPKHCSNNLLFYFSSETAVKFLSFLFVTVILKINNYQIRREQLFDNWFSFKLLVKTSFMSLSYVRKSEASNCWSQYTYTLHAIYPRLIQRHFSRYRRKAILEHSFSWHLKEPARVSIGSLRRFQRHTGLSLNWMTLNKPLWKHLTGLWSEMTQNFLSAFYFCKKHCNIWNIVWTLL